MKKKVMFLLIGIFFLINIYFVNAVTNVTGCGVLNVTNEIYELNVSLSSSFDCITINATNITLDCMNYNISFGNATGGFGIAVSGDGGETGIDNITIQNCYLIQNESGLNDSAIFFGPSSENAVIFNNTIENYGNETLGIMLESNSVNANVSSNIIYTNGTGTSSGTASGIIIAENGINAIMENNLILTLGNDNSGIFLMENVSEITIYNNTLWIMGNRTISDHAMGGVVMDQDTYDLNISSNLIIMGLSLSFIEDYYNYSEEDESWIFNGGGYDTAGVWVWGDNSTIDNNLIVSFGELGDGIFLNDIEGINITSNIIATLGEQGDGILSQMSEEASLLFYNNVIGTFGENSSGIHLAQDSYSNLSLNNISTFGNYSYGVFFNESHNNTIASNRITTWQSTSYLIYLTTSGNQTVYDNFLNTSTTGSGIYITDSNLNYFNTSAAPFTNIIGKGYFGGNFWTNANGNGYSDYCVNFGSDYYCDSSYRIVEGIDSYDYLPLTNYLSNLSACGNLDTKKRYILNTSLSSNGTCFNITINRVFLDLAGNTITGNATGDGINISGYNDTTIKDGLIYNFSNGIFLNNSQDNNITNITLGDNNRSLYIDSSPSNVFSDITLNNSGQNGVYLNGTASSNNNFTDVMVENSIAPYYDIEFGTEGINGTWIIDSLFTSYAFAGEGGIVNFKISGYAMVEFLEPINGSGAYLTLRDVDIDNNLLFVNSSSNSGLNKSAKITFYGISYTDPKPQYSSDNSVWTDCTASTDPSCNEVSYSGTTFVFNVSHFTYFRSAETTTSSIEDDDSSSSGGGYPTFRPTEEELKNGYTKFLYRNWKISFKVENVSHIFKVENVNATNSKISISSETQEATLSVGEEKKFDLSGDDSYDLQVKLNSIDSSKANFTLQTIHELPESENGENGESFSEKIDTLLNEDSSLKWIFLAVIIILIGILLSKGRSMKRSSRKK